MTNTRIYLDTDQLVELTACGSNVELTVYAQDNEIEVDMLLSPAQARKLAMYLLMRADEMEGNL